MKTKEYLFPLTELEYFITCTNTEDVETNEDKYEEVKHLFNWDYMYRPFNKVFRFSTAEQYWRARLPLRNQFGTYTFDGEAICIADAKGELAARLKPGESAQLRCDVKDYHVEMKVSWPEWKINRVPVEKMLEEMAKDSDYTLTWRYTGEDRMEVLSSTDGEEWKAWRTYKATKFLTEFTADMKNEPSLLQPFDAILVRQINTYHSMGHTSDYIDAAEAYGEEVGSGPDSGESVRFEKAYFLAP
ncbi:MAG: hypothetical protein IJS82_01880 [Paludibacteraceae bacterium]|nr:hypothetical protein [Paludibacteraceae bacterium]